MAILSMLALGFISPIPRAHASGSTFTASLSTTGVTSIPSVPTGLAALPVSDSIIDLSWSPSTEGVYSIAGYRIFRDGTFLATTSIVSYVDSGLMASTTYSYTVEAFDTIMDLSGQSSPVSATTFPVPPPPPVSTSTPPSSGGGPGNGSGSTMLQIFDIKIVPGLNQATVSFSTNMPVLAEVMWGRTPDYEAGSLMSPFYDYTHELLLNGLDAQTTYLLKIVAVNIQGVSVAAEATFTTSAPLLVSPLANPSDFRAKPFSDHIHLSWTDPDDPRVSTFRIVRSSSFFPRDQFDGEPIYEDPGSSFDDRDVIPGKTYYYAIFSESSDGVFSSGALAAARVPLPGEQLGTAVNPFANIAPSPIVNPIIAALTLSDFIFTQSGQALPVVGGKTVSIDGTKDLTIQLPYDKVPQVLKTIAITLQDPDDAAAVFTFLLRADADQTYYEATIGALGHSGDYTLSVVILDYQNMSMKRLAGDLRALVFEAPILNGSDHLALAFLLALVLLLCIILAVRHQRKDGDKEKRKDVPEPA